MNLLLVLSVLGSDIVHLELRVIFDLSDGFIVIKLLVVNFFSHLFSLSSLSFHGGMVFVHQGVNLLVMGLNNISNSLLEVSGFLLLLGLELLELSCIFKHLLRVSVSVLFKLNLLVLNLSLDLFFKDLLEVPLVFHKRIISISVLELRAG